MERHLEESVLSKLPDNYQDTVKQSIISEESDMSMQSLISHLVFFYFPLNAPLPPQPPLLPPPQLLCVPMEISGCLRYGPYSDDLSVAVV